MDSLGRQMLAVAAGWKEPVYRYYLPARSFRPNFEDGYHKSALTKEGATAQQLVGKKN